MALTAKALAIIPEDNTAQQQEQEQEQREPRGRGRPSYEPEPRYRQMVEVLVAVGASHEAICRELVRYGQECASRETLRRAFAEELAHGRERRILGYAVKVHALAMGETAAALPAAKYLLGVLGGQQWRLGSQEGADAVAPGLGEGNGGAAGNGSTVHIVIPDNGRGYPKGVQPSTITIDGVVELVKDETAGGGT
jgi:hypothetical protein